MGVLLILLKNLVKGLLSLFFMVSMAIDVSNVLIEFCNIVNLFSVVCGNMFGFMFIICFVLMYVGLSFLMIIFVFFVNVLLFLFNSAFSFVMASVVIFVKNGMFRFKNFFYCCCNVLFCLF